MCNFLPPCHVTFHSCSLLMENYPPAPPHTGLQDEYESWIRGLRLILMRIYGQPLATTGAVRPKGDKMVPVKQSRSGSPRSSKHEAEDDGSVEGGEDGEGEGQLYFPPDPSSFSTRSVLIVGSVFVLL